MATLDKKAPPKSRATRAKKTEDTSVTLAQVAETMRIAKETAAVAETQYKASRLEFLALMGDKKETELDGYVYTVTVPVTTTFDAEGLYTDHPEAAVLIKVEEVTTTHYSLDEDVAQEAIADDTEGLVLALIQSYVTETPGAPRVNIKEQKTDA